MPRARWRLMQEFFESRLGLTNHSPALMKALLINGARSVSDQYDFNVQRRGQLPGLGADQSAHQFARRSDQPHGGHQFDLFH